MEKKNFAFDRVNYILLAVSAILIVVGLVMMSGSSSTVEQFNPDIFSFRRIKVAPVITFIGFVSIIYAVIRKPKDKK